MERDSPACSISPRFLLVGVALVAPSLANVSSSGYYTNTAGVGVLAALVLALAACRRGLDAPRNLPSWFGSAALGAVAVVLVAWSGITDWVNDASRLALLPGVVFLAIQALRERLRGVSLPLTLLSAAALLLAGRAAHGRLPASDLSAALLTVRVAEGVGFLLVAVLVGLDLPTGGRSGMAFRTRLVLLFAAGAVLRLAVVVAWPEPPIDVFVWLHDSPHALLAGNNPYTPDHGILVGLASYPPLPIILTLPFAALRLDVRLANVVGDLFAAWVLYRVARRDGRPLVGALAAGAYLNLPGVTYMLTYAWYEPMLAALLGSGLLLAERRKWIANILLGLGLTGKQFGLALAVPLWSACRGRRRTFLAGIALAGVLVILPFFLWSPRALMNAVVHYHIAIGPDLRSLTIRSVIYRHLGVVLPGWMATLMTLLLTVWIAWRTPQQGSRTAVWMGTALLVFCFLFVKGYFNYFYLCSYLFLLGLAALNPAGDREAVAVGLPPSAAPTHAPQPAQAA